MRSQTPRWPAGRVLCAALGVAVAASAAAPGVVTVRRGDTLTALARQHGSTVAALRQANALGVGDVLYAGSTLTLPAPPQSPAPAPAPAPRPVPPAVAASAAAHRAQLAARTQPGKPAVRAMVAAAARTYGVDPSLALAVAYHESGFQQRVVSPVDAIGAMQVLPSNTARLSVSAGRRLDLLRAEDNVTAGVVLLRDLRRATGSDEATLAAYYQGLGSIARQGLLPVTRDYVAHVTALRPRFSG